MTDELLFDAFQVLLFIPAGADGATADAARAALDEPTLLVRMRDAVAALLATDPALAALSVRVEF